MVSLLFEKEGGFSSIFVFAWRFVVFELCQLVLVYYLLYFILFNGGIINSLEEILIVRVRRKSGCIED